MYFCRLFTFFALFLACCHAYGIPLNKKPECPSVCTAIYQPICATNGVTQRVFSNDCHMAIENCNTPGSWRKVKNGPC
ncbi:PI-actitoxin-Avd5a [Nilaparvata lugens]|uniref:PI-actitoxin-Avd5a n=1 Tax=Nilaparvata lugens TaxID=108931 RepID=UPI000B984EEA|nr:PI-actitoxin-Avd5a [Nilaparvata lugens]